MSAAEKNQWILQLEAAAKLQAQEYVAALVGVDSTQRLVLYGLATLVDAKYEVDVPLKKICDHTSLSRRAVQNAIYGCKSIRAGRVLIRKSIEEASPGTLTVIERKVSDRQNLPNMYRLGVPEVSAIPKALASPASSAPPPSLDSVVPVPAAAAPLPEDESTEACAAPAGEGCADSAGKSHSSINKINSFIKKDEEDQSSNKQSKEDCYPEEFFAEKIVRIWNTRMAPLGAATVADLDESLRRDFLEAYRLNTDASALERYFRKSNNRLLTNLYDWLAFFRYLTQSDYLMGRTKLRDGRSFHMSLKFLLGKKDDVPRILLARNEHYNYPATVICEEPFTMPDFSDIDAGTR